MQEKKIYLVRIMDTTDHKNKLESLMSKFRIGLNEWVRIDKYLNESVVYGIYTDGDTFQSIIKCYNRLNGFES